VVAEHPGVAAVQPIAGVPNQFKLGDYCQMISDDLGAGLAYAATFNGGQDVYFLRIDRDCNSNLIDDATDIASMTSADCNANQIPDECDIVSGGSTDANGNSIPDECECALYPATLTQMRSLRIDTSDSRPATRVDDRASCDARRYASAIRGACRHTHVGGFPAGCSAVPESGNFLQTRAAHLCARVSRLGLARYDSGVDDEIVPGALYEIQAVSQACDPGVEGNYTTPLEIRTVARWADVTSPFNPRARRRSRTSRTCP